MGKRLKHPEVEVKGDLADDLFPGDDGKDRKARFNMAHWINPERAEMFFARRAVFVEGPTERVILPYLAKRLGVLDPEVSIIDCGSLSVRDSSSIRPRA